MKPKWYNLICRALDEGIIQGWNRAHKYSDAPDTQFIRDEIVEAQLHILNEVIDFEDEPVDGNK